MPTLRERFRGALLGVAAGDALGQPFEGQTPVDGGAVRAWADGGAPLRWTDDTHMTIGLARSLIARRGLDPDHLAQEFARNYRLDPQRGYGAGPPAVFEAMARGAGWREAAGELFSGHGSYGNGAAMRVAPIGLIAYRHPADAAALARASAAVTHAHELGEQAAALQATAIAAAVGSQPPAPDDFVDRVRWAAPAAPFRERLDAVSGLPPDAPTDRVVAMLGHGIAGYESVPTAIWAFTSAPGDVERAILRAVCLGGDTDTIAAMTGALAGAYAGAEAIPARWLERLEAADELIALADELVILA